MLDLNLHMVYFIMQNYPVVREGDETEWLDPLFLEASTSGLKKIYSSHFLQNWKWMNLVWDLGIL